MVKKKRKKQTTMVKFCCRIREELGYAKRLFKFLFPVPIKSMSEARFPSDTSPRAASCHKLREEAEDSSSTLPQSHT